MRLSTALGDLRIAGHYATRRRQNVAERVYFVRLLASHMREIVLIMDPPDARVVPTVESFWPHCLEAQSHHVQRFANRIGGHFVSSIGRW